MSSELFHIISKSALTDFERSGQYAPESLVTEGFIHLSYADQVRGVWGRYYQESAELYVIEFNPNDLASSIVVEDTTGSGEKFPHCYGELSWSSVVSAMPLLEWLA